MPFYWNSKYFSILNTKNCFIQRITPLRLLTFCLHCTLPNYNWLWHLQVSLPARMTVEQILSNYVKYKTASKSTSSKTANRESAVIEVSSGLKVSQHNLLFASFNLLKVIETVTQVKKEKDKNLLLVNVF